MESYFVRRRVEVRLLAVELARTLGFDDKPKQAGDDLLASLNIGIKGIF